MAYEIQGNKKDCVIISVVNYTGKDYDTVLSYARMLGIKHDYSFKGTPDTAIQIILSAALGCVARRYTPRRGQEKLNGIAVWKRPGRKNGHATCVIDGNVFDTDGRIWAIAEYRERYNYSLKCCYA